MQSIKGNANIYTNFIVINDVCVSIYKDYIHNVYNPITYL